MAEQLSTADGSSSSSSDVSGHSTPYTSPSNSPMLGAVHAQPQPQPQHPQIFHANDGGDTNALMVLEPPQQPPYFVNSAQAGAPNPAPDVHQYYPPVPVYTSHGLGLGPGQVLSQEEFDEMILGPAIGEEGPTSPFLQPGYRGPLPGTPVSDGPQTIDYQVESGVAGPLPDHDPPPQNSPIAGVSSQAYYDPPTPEPFYGDYYPLDPFSTGDIQQQEQQPLFLDEEVFDTLPSPMPGPSYFDFPGAILPPPLVFPTVIPSGFSDQLLNPVYAPLPQIFFPPNIAPGGSLHERIDDDDSATPVQSSMDPPTPAQMAEYLLWQEQVEFRIDALISEASAREMQRWRSILGDFDEDERGAAERAAAERFDAKRIEASRLGASVLREAAVAARAALAVWRELSGVGPEAGTAYKYYEVYEEYEDEYYEDVEYYEDEYCEYRRFDDALEGQEGEGEVEVEDKGKQRAKEQPST